MERWLYILGRFLILMHWSGWLYLLVRMREVDIGEVRCGWGGLVLDYCRDGA